MKIGIDPKIDYAFKKLFGQERNKALLIHLINAVLQPPAGSRVVDVHLLNPFNEKEAEDDKLSIVDVKARDQSGRHFNVEMQIIADRYFRQRLLYYWGKLHVSQLKEADPFHLLRPTVCIAFVDSVLFVETPSHHLTFRLREQMGGLIFCEDLEMHILELPKFAKNAEDLADPLDGWLYFLRRGSDLDPAVLPPVFGAAEFSQAVKELTMLTQDDLERERYEARVKMHRDILTREHAAREEGLEEGLEKGLEQGLEQGLEKGRREGAVVGEILAYRHLLGLAPLASEELFGRPLQELQTLADALAAEIRKPKS